MAILGISTNTRLLGMAVITQKGLATYQLRLHKASWGSSKVTQILASVEPCVRRYSIKKVVLSIPYAHHQTKEFKLLLSAIRRLFKEKAIPVQTHSAKAIYTFCHSGQKKTKKTAMKSLSELFPELRPCYHKELRNKNKYYIKLFEAVAVARLEAEKK